MPREGCCDLDVSLASDRGGRSGIALPRPVRHETFQKRLANARDKIRCARPNPVNR